MPVAQLKWVQFNLNLSPLREGRVCTHRYRQKHRHTHWDNNIVLSFMKWHKHFCWYIWCCLTARVHCVHVFCVRTLADASFCFTASNKPLISHIQHVLAQPIWPFSTLLYSIIYICCPHLVSGSSQTKPLGGAAPLQSFTLWRQSSPSSWRTSRSAVTVCVTPRPQRISVPPLGCFHTTWFKEEKKKETAAAKQKPGFQTGCFFLRDMA